MLLRPWGSRQANAAIQRRRIKRRFRANWRVVAQSGPRTIQGEALDVSDGGILFVTATRLSRGDVVALDVAAKNDSFFRCSVMIAWEGRGENGLWKYGGAFTGMTMRDTQIFREAFHGLVGPPRVTGRLMCADATPASEYAVLKQNIRSEDGILET